MDKLKFADADLNDKFEILAKKDQRIRTPDGYNGLITRIRDEAILEGMVSRKSNLVARKSKHVPAPAASGKPAAGEPAAKGK